MYNPTEEQVKAVNTLTFPDYKGKIQALEERRSELTAEAGPNGTFCVFTQAAVKLIDYDLQEVYEAAADKMQDLLTD